MRTAALLVAIVLVAAAHLRAADPIPVPAPAPAAAPVSARAWLGVGLDEVDAALAYHLQLANDLGVLVSEVEPGSPAEAMGLKPYDVIVEFAQAPIYTPRALAEAVRGCKPGERIELVVRRGAQRETLGGALAAAPPRPPAMSLPEGIPPELRQRLEQHLKERGQRRMRAENPDGSALEWEGGCKPSEF